MAVYVTRGQVFTIYKSQKMIIQRDKVTCSKSLPCFSYFFDKMFLKYKNFCYSYTLTILYINMQPKTIYLHSLWSRQAKRLYTYTLNPLIAVLDPNTLSSGFSE